MSATAAVNRHEDDESDNLTRPLRADLGLQNEQVKKDGSKFIYILAGFSAIGGFLFGYDTGVVSGAMLIIRREMQLNNTWHEAIVSGTVAAAWIFALVAGYLSDRLGRKPVIVAASVVFALGSVVMGAANDKETLLIGRIIVGIAIGLASMIVPMYLAETSSASERGLLVTLNVMFITGGQAAAAVFSGFLSRHHDGWRYMLGIAAIPAAIQFIGFLFMPESPRWLISRGRTDEARNVLRRIRGTFDVDDEIEAIKASAEEAERELKRRHHRGQTSNVFIQVMQSPPVRRALFLGCLLQMFQQIAGINTVMYYSATIIQMAGFYNTSMAIWLAALVAAINFLCTFVGLYLVERVGRRRLTLVSLAGVVLSLAFLGAGFLVADSHSVEVTLINDTPDMCGTAASCGECGMIQDCGFCFFDDPVQGAVNGTCLMSRENMTEFTSDYGPCSSLSSSDSIIQGESRWIWSYGWCPSPYGWITVVGLVMYLFFFAPGMGPMPWTINSEIYPLWARGTCNSIATSTNWFFNLVISMTFLTFMEILGREGAFFLYCGLAAVGLVIFWLILPETKGRSLEEMEVLFARPWACPCVLKKGDAPDDGSADPSAAKTVHSSGERQRWDETGALNTEQNL